MSGAPANSPVNVYVKYTKATANTEANIQYFSDSAGTNPWKEADPIPHGTKTKFTFWKTTSTDGFNFDAAVFYPKDANGGILSNVVQSFRNTANGTAKFQGTVFVDQINLEPSQNFVIFWVVNNNNSGADGFVGVHITILTQDSGNYLTSVDPKVPLPPSG